MRLTFSLFLLMFVFWSLNSEIHSNLLLVLELASIGLVLMIARSMKLMDRETQPLYLLTKIFPFYLWLLKEIVCGSYYVLKKIIQGRSSLSPQVVTVELEFKDEMSKVIFANSITMVPGTLSLELKHNSVKVHTLTKELMESLLEGTLTYHIKRLEQ